MDGLVKIRAKTNPITAPIDCSLMLHPTQLLNIGELVVFHANSAFFNQSSSQE
jgi:hypothetical protein